jgi:signal peptidase I
VRGPIDRLTATLPAPWRTIVDWVVTIAIAVAAVIAIKLWIVNPYRIPSSSMEATLHCARPAPGCLARFSDRVLANRFIYHFKDPDRKDIVVFDTPERAVVACALGEKTTFVKRLIGLPGDRVEQRQGVVFVNGQPLDEPYIEPERRGGRDFAVTVPEDAYWVMGDNRDSSCDSRAWGPVPKENLIGEVFAVYWPPNRIGFR